MPIEKFPLQPISIGIRKTINHLTGREKSRVSLGKMTKCLVWEGEGAEGDFTIPKRVDPLYPTPEMQQLRLNEIVAQHDTLMDRLDNQYVRGAVEGHLYSNQRDRELDLILNPNFRPTLGLDPCSIVFFDIETLRLPSDQEIKGTYMTSSTTYIAKQEVGAAVTIDDQGNVLGWDDRNVVGLVQHLNNFDIAVGFNSIGFDNIVLSGDRGVDAQALSNRSFDLMLYVEMLTGKRRSLDWCAKHFLGMSKDMMTDIGGNMSIPRIIREGESWQKQRVWQRCCSDVQLTMGLYKHFNIGFTQRADLWEWYLQRIDDRVSFWVNQKIMRDISHLQLASIHLQPEGPSFYPNWTWEPLKKPLDKIKKEYSHEVWVDLLANLMGYEIQDADILAYIISQAPQRIIPNHEPIEGDNGVFNHDLIMFPTTYIDEEQINEMAHDMCSHYSIWDKYESVQGIIPQTVIEGTDFLEKVSKNNEQDYLQTVTAHGKTSQYFQFQDREGNSGIVINRLTKPALDAGLLDVLKTSQYIIYQSATQKAIEVLDQECLSDKVCWLSIEEIINRGLAEERSLPEDDKVTNIIDEVKIHAQERSSGYLKDICIEAEPILIHHLDKCQQLLNSISGAQAQKYQQRLQLELLLGEYSLLFVRSVVEPGELEKFDKRIQQIAQNIQAID